MASKAHVLAFPRRESTLSAVKQTLAKSREVIIASGVHSGARITVNDGDLIVVGADEGCDVCLSDSGIAARHAAIALHGPDITIRSLDGAISVDDQQIHATKRVAASDATVITLGSDAVRLEIPATAVAPAHSGRHTSTSSPPTLKRRAIALLCFSLFAVVATVLVARKLDASLAAKPAKPDVAAVQSMLDQQGLSKIVTASMESHGVAIKGVLDRETATKLRGAIAGSRQPIVDRVITKEDLVEQVRDVFRTQGYEANVTHIDGARVQVGNLDESNERVRHAAEAVRTDVPQLDALIFASPNDATPPADAPPYGNRAGDRIVTRIDGKTAYLVAGAGTRYFKGSKLPSGHTIRRITREAVQLERDGQIDWFRF
jgi:type III secretion system YscD/HrpQ family protein